MRLRSLACLGLMLACGHLVTGVAVADEVSVRVMNVITGKPVQGVDVQLEFSTRYKAPTSTDGVARFNVETPQSGERSCLSSGGKV
jgi:hypothetical protein